MLESLKHEKLKIRDAHVKRVIRVNLVCFSSFSASISALTGRTTMNRSALDSPSLGEHSDNLKHVDRMRKKFFKRTERHIGHFL